MRLFAVSLLAGSCMGAATPVNRRKLSYTSILGYSPGTQVDDHARIDLDQAAIETALKTPDYAKAKKIYETGIYSKPSAVCTVAASGTLGTAGSKSDKVYFQAYGTDGTDGNWLEGKAYSSYAATDTSITFTYPVDESQIVYSYDAPVGPSEPAAGACWVGEGGARLGTPAQKNCVKGSEDDPASSTSTSVIAIGTGTKGASGCKTGTGTGTGFAGCTDISAQITVDCVNRGKRTLQGFSTAAKKKMYDPTLASPDCPTASTAGGYAIGCPYTSYKPYWDYYCNSASSACNGSGDYANQIVLAALDGTKVTLDNSAGSDFSKVTDAKARVEMIKKGTAYMNAWMYAIREFEDAIDDCVSGTPSNADSEGSVHAWDEGVAFYVGSVMRAETAMFTRPDGFLAYTLGNKRCGNYKTCGVNGDSTSKEQSKQNTELFALFTDGQQKLVTGDCGGAVPVKDHIVEWMTVPLVQGTLRYAFKMTTSSTAGAKEAGEGAIFALSVLPQLHKCSPTAAATVNTNLNIDNFYGAKAYDYNAVKAAFEGCYAKMFPTIADPCGAIGGLWSSGAYKSATINGVVYDASPCAAPAPPSAPPAAATGLSGGALAGIIVGAALAVVFLVVLLVVICKEKSGTPIFVPTGGKPGSV